MKNFIETLKKIISPINLLTILTVFFAVLVTFVVEIEVFPPEKITVILISFIIGNILFEKIAVSEKTSDAVVNISDWVRQLVARMESPQDFIHFGSDADASEMMRTISANKTLEKVEILSSGLTSRQGIIPVWLNAGVPVEAIVQDPATALDKKDKEHVVSATDWIYRQAAKNFNLLEVKLHINISTVRAVILHERKNQIKHVFVSWYYYYNANKKIMGVMNPTMYCSTATKQGNELYLWLAKVIQNNRQESQKIDALELIDAG
jgi:hypothetical protein